MKQNLLLFNFKKICFDYISDEKVDVPSPVYNLETIPHNTNLNTSHNDFPSKPMSMTPCTELVTRTDEVSLLSLAPSHQHPESSIAQGMAAGEPHTTYSSTCSTVSIAMYKLDRCQDYLKKKIISYKN